jgi:transposase InsO family protein
MCTIGATAARTGAMPAEGERQRSAQSSPRVNPKRAYRVTAQAGLLLPKTPRRRPSSRKHEGTVTVGRRNGRWCCDGLEIRCDSGQTVTATFAKDCCDREVIAWRAWEGNPYDGHTLREQLEQATILMQDSAIEPATVFVDLGYRGVDALQPGCAQQATTSAGCCA